MTLAEAMAVAVLKGDTLAAEALADKLIEERNSPPRQPISEFPPRTALPSQPVSGYEVFRWPEFIAFSNRLGLKWDLLTRLLTIRLDVDEVVSITQGYVGNQPPPSSAKHKEEVP